MEMSSKEKYKALYLESMKEDKPTTEEMDVLFQDILLNEMNDDPEKMSEFVQSIVDEYSPQEPSELELLKEENEKLQASIKSMEEESEMIQAAFMELSDYVFSK